MEPANTASLFHGISGSIDIGKLEHENRKFLVAGFLCAVAMLIAISPFVSFRRSQVQQETYRRITLIDFVSRPPKDYAVEPGAPLHHDPWERELQRAESYFRYKKPWNVLESADKELEYRFMAGIDRELRGEIYRLTDRDMLPDSLRIAKRYVPGEYGHATKITREIEREFSLHDELLTLDDIDRKGTYKGFVIQDPTDKQNIKGFFYMPRYVKEMGITPTRANPHYNLINAVPGLAEAFNYYTGLTLKVDGSISILDARLSDYPVVYLTTDTTFVFDLNTNAVRSYIMNGGFVILDNGTPWGDYTPAEATLMNLLYRTFGKDFKLQRIPRDHPVYHCFFDFAGVPPDGAENRTPPQRPEYRYSSSVALPPNPFGKVFHIPELERTRMRISDDLRSLWGVWIGERLVAVYCDKGYGHLWRDGVTLNKHRDGASSDGTKYNFNPQLKMGVNLLVYALIQRGGIAKQYVDHRAHADTSEYSARFIQHDNR